MSKIIPNFEVGDVVKVYIDGEVTYGPAVIKQILPNPVEGYMYLVTDGKSAYTLWEWELDLDEDFAKSKELNKEVEEWLK